MHKPVSPHLAGTSGHRRVVVPAVVVLLSEIATVEILMVYPAVPPIAPSFGMLLVGHAAQGALVGIVASSYSLVHDVMPRDFVPIALGIVATGIGMSAIAGPFVAGRLFDGFGYHAVFWFLAAYVTLPIPLYATVVPTIVVASVMKHGRTPAGGGLRESDDTGVVEDPVPARS